MSYLLAQASAHRIPLRDESVQTCVTSPPYWGLRAYAGEQRVKWVDGTTHPLSLEPTPELYVAHMVEVFREVWRVLRKDGTAWINLGDSFVNKNLCGIPWRVALALQADGWYLRSDIVWSKANPMPESVTDRPTKAHEYVFLMSKSDRYFYDDDAVREENTGTVGNARSFRGGGAYTGGQSRDNSGMVERETHGNDGQLAGRNMRTVWQIATQPYPGAHFATFPEALPERCIKAGSAAQACGVCGAPWERVTEQRLEPAMNPGRRPVLSDRAQGIGDSPMDDQGIRRARDGHIPGYRRADITLGFRPTCDHDDGSSSSVVLDPFNGSGTTGRVALSLGRRYVGLDMSREYLTEQAIARIDPITHAARTSDQLVLGL